MDVGLLQMEHVEPVMKKDECDLVDFRLFESRLPLYVEVANG